ncbi:MAG: NTF2-like N-terminal transpeptidase domain-containing protein [Candidatus Humimicrobiaceae bacterium]
MSKATVFLLISIIILIVIFSCSCSFSNIKIDAAYLLKTDPEKSVIDFLKSLNTKSPVYIYDNLLSVKDKDNISKDKFTEELSLILTDIDEIEILKTTYLGYEDKGGLVKVVVEFKVKYKNSEINKYKKYIYLVEENQKWKIVFEKTFI